VRPTVQDPKPAVTRPAPRYDPRLLESHRYPLHRVLETMFCDMDVQRHVNNVAIVRYFEEGRSSLRRAVDTRCSGVAGSVVLARFDVLYLREVSYPGTVEVAIGTGRVGTSSYEVVAALFQDGQCAALSWATSSRRTADRSAKQPLGDPERAALAQFAVAIDPSS
jgi:acyl-CoA thioester hydrolase